jgi:hypothetical protein
VKIEPISANEGCTRLWKSEIHFDGIFEGLGVQPHVVYGLIVGTIYAAVDRLWIALFIESDLINRQPEAPGSRTVRSIGWGAVAGLVGGLVFLPIITIVTGLSHLAGLVGGTSPVVGVLVHLFISGLIGISYGLYLNMSRPTLLPASHGVSFTVWCGGLSAG